METTNKIMEYIPSIMLKSVMKNLRHAVMAGLVSMMAVVGLQSADWMVVAAGVYSCSS